MEVINPQLKELERKQDELRSSVDYMRGEIAEIKRTSRDTGRQTIWQFVIFTVTMTGVVLGALIGGVKYQTEILRREMDVRFDAVNKRFDAMEKRIEQTEKNLTARFEDLKQEVRASRK